MMADASRMAGGRRRVRVDGGARVTLRDDAGTTRLRELWHHDPMRVLLPEPVDDSIPHVVLLNTAGGLVGGDSLRTEIEVGDRARALVTGQAAEKVYRSDGPEVAIRTALSAGRDHVAVAPRVIARGLPLQAFIGAFAYFFTVYTRPWAAPNPRDPAFVGIGAFNMVRAAVYRAHGGHAPIRLRPDDDQLQRRHAHSQ